jgi:hypothetical protein
MQRPGILVFWPDTSLLAKLRLLTEFGVVETHGCAERVALLLASLAEVDTPAQCLFFVAAEAAWASCPCGRPCK